MSNILLCCGGGFSSSLLVTKMQESAKKQGLDHKIWAIGAGEAKDQTHHLREADVLLVGPQIRYVIADFEKVAERESVTIPIKMIPPIHYGTCNGAEVLTFAEALIKENSK